MQVLENQPGAAAVLVGVRAIKEGRGVSRRMQDAAVNFSLVSDTASLPKRAGSVFLSILAKQPEIIVVQEQASRDFTEERRDVGGRLTFDGYRLTVPVEDRREGGVQVGSHEAPKPAA